jgi:hypothetical protein
MQPALSRHRTAPFHSSYLARASAKASSLAGAAMAEPGLLLRGNSYVDQAQQSEMKKIMTAELKQEDPTQESLENRVNGMKVARSEKDLEGFEDDGEDDGWIDAVQQTTEQANARA